MTRLRNDRTGTVHKIRPGATDGETACGALRYVPQQYVTPVAGDELPSGEDTNRCGRCFEDAGGY